MVTTLCTLACSVIFASNQIVGPHWHNRHLIVFVISTATTGATCEASNMIWPFSMYL